MPKSLVKYIWKISGIHQVWLALITIAVVILSLAPLELQRRTINDAIKNHAVKPLLVLCVGYLGVVLAQGLLKLWLNVYRSWIGEVATRQLRLHARHAMAEVPSHDKEPVKEGVQVAIVLSEVDPVGAFVGTSVSEPLLHGGLLVSVFGYMLVVQPLMALACLGVFAPQFVFVPIMQGAINRATKRRIKVLREVSTGMMTDAVESLPNVPEEEYAAHTDQIFKLDMRIYRLKFGMNFMMNLLYHIAIVGVLGLGGWLVIEGRTEVGTIVAFISGLDKVNDPWGDIVNYFRDLASAHVKYRMIAKVFDDADERKIQPEPAPPPAIGARG